jgi:hypothetical protein
VGLKNHDTCFLNWDHPLAAHRWNPAGRYNIVWPTHFWKDRNTPYKNLSFQLLLKKKIRWAGNPQRQSFALQKLAVSGLCLSSWDGFAVPLLDCLGSSLYQSIAVTWLLAVQKQRGIGLSTFSWVHISLCLVDHFCSWGLWIFFLFLQDVHFLLYFVIWSHLFSICQSFLFVYLKEEECCKNTSIST